MKRIFIEPEIQKIELNLQENIAVSTTTSGGITFMVGERNCFVVNTGKTANELFIWDIFGTNCYNSFSKSGITVPVERARQYFMH